MKKTVIFMVCALLMVMAFASCGKKDNVEESSSPKDPIASGVESTVESEVKTQGESKLTEYIKEVNKHMDGMENMFGDTLTMNIVERDGAFVYDLQLIEDAGVDDEELKTVYDQMFGLQESVFMTVVEEMAKYGIENPVVIIEIKNTSGGIIADYEFK